MGAEGSNFNIKRISDGPITVFVLVGIVSFFAFMNYEKTRSKY